jgi:hypothetical protein
MSSFNELVDVAQTIEHAEFSVDVKMGKRHVCRPGKVRPLYR